MNKKNIIENVNEAFPNLTIKQCATAVNIVLQSISDGIANEETVILSNFGTFKAVDVPEKPGRNLITNEPVTIPAHKRIAFKSSKVLWDKVNK